MRKLVLPLDAGEIDTQEKREAVCWLMAGELKMVLDAEKEFLEGLPAESFREGRACHALDCLAEATRALEDAYDFF
ncbi:MAG: hypothetical protein FWG03_09770 [Clostridiales bacterium]|jgi:hypothetical protein|nr:hypothetical protein [Clostridiales bacterium]